MEDANRSIVQKTCDTFQTWKQENENITQQEIDDGYHPIQELQTALKEDDEMMDEASLNFKNQIRNMEIIASKCSSEMRQKSKCYMFVEILIEMIGILLLHIPAERNQLESSHGEC